MPFATKFRAMMDLPFAGDAIGDFSVERVDVRHESRGPGLYVYSAQIVLHGPGGQRGVRLALKALCSSHPTTFSGYGNPYQLWFGKPEIESLGEKRYAVSIEGAGARVFLEDELERFLTLTSIQSHLITVAIAGLSLLVLLFDGQPGWAGIVYFLMAPAHTIQGIRTGARADKIQRRLAAAQPAGKR